MPAARILLGAAVLLAVAAQGQPIHDPGPPTIQDVHVTSVTDTTATLAWNITGPPDSESWIIYWNPANNDTRGTERQGGAGSQNHTLDDLQPGTTYYAVVRAELGGGGIGRSESEPVEINTTASQSSNPNPNSATPPSRGSPQLPAAALVMGLMALASLRIRKH